MRIIDYLYEYEYMIGYKSVNDTQYRFIFPNSRYWYADPIMVKIGDELYIFMEAFDKFEGLGKIAISKYSEEGHSFSTPQIIISERFHMSFPYVFAYHGEYYMLPEANDSGKFQLYKMGKDVYDWNLCCTHPMDRKYTDVAVYIQNSNEEDGDLEELFFFAGETDPSDPLKCKSVIMKVRDLEQLDYDIVYREDDYSYDDRNGGRIEITEREGLLRVFQHSTSEYYGLYITLEKVLFDEKTNKYCRNGDIVRKIDVQSEKIVSSKKMVPYGIHTYGWIGDLAVIDVGIKRISLDGLLYKIVRRLR